MKADELDAAIDAIARNATSETDAAGTDLTARVVGAIEARSRRRRVLVTRVIPAVAAASIVGVALAGWISRRGDAPVESLAVEPMVVVRVDRTGREQQVGAPLKAYTSIRVSPDGRLVALATDDPVGGPLVNLFDLNRRLLTPVAHGAEPAWGERGTVLFVREPPPSATPWGMSWMSAAAGVLGVFVLSRPPDDVAFGEPVRGEFVSYRVADRLAAAVSPDGRWIATDAFGSGEIVVGYFPDGGNAGRTVATVRGRQPVWSPDGSELYFIRSDGAQSFMMSRPVRGDQDPVFGPARQLFLLSWAVVQRVGDRIYDILPDGDFLMIRPVGRREVE